ILSDDHLSILQLQRLTDVKFAIVHFTGGAPQSTALLGGHIDVGFENVGLYAAQKKAGKVRILAVMDRERSKFMPDVPTAEEQGFKLYSSSNRPLSAPAGTPKEIVWFISSAMEQAMKDPGLIAKM
ncbi:MAG: tripartite tricarboxylate transporter substrate-binding protein, partial [Chloroflexota bacterium]